MTSRQHPLEQVFNLETGEYFDALNNREGEHGEIAPIESTLPTSTTSSDNPVPDHKDEDDKEIDANIAQVYDKAIQAFDRQSEMVEIVDPRYSARTAEVAATYLNIALTAMAVKSKTKTDRVKRNQTSVPYNNGPKTVNNNLIVADRNSILKALRTDSESNELPKSEE